MRYFVVNTESKRTMFGPFYNRDDADRRHYIVCNEGIPDPSTGGVARPRCAVIGEGGIVPSESGNHFLHEEANCVSA